MSDDLLNEIDDVAREMTAGAPPSRMRARVMARIAAPDRPRWRSAWVWSPIGAAAAIGLAIYLMPATAPNAPAPSIVQAPPEAAVPTPPVTPPVGADLGRPPAAEEPRPAVSGPSRTAVVAFAPARVEFEPAPIDVPLLDDVAAIATNDLMNDPLQMEPLEAIAPIAVRALNTEGEEQ